MDAIGTLKLLSGQMELEKGEDASLAERRGASRNAVEARSSSPPDGSAQTGTKPACFTPKARPEFTEREKKAAFVHPAQLPNGKQILLLKTLLSSACERDCYYCPFRAGRNFRRATFKPQEFAELFMKLNQAKAAEGIFLSSGIAAGGANTQNRILDTAEILRNKLGYRGYMHLKIMPGAERGQVERTMQLADRVSVNLEAPNTERLARLAPHKTFLEELLQPLKWVEEIRRSQPAYRFWNGRHPSAVTQFVAGGADESDLELLTTTDWLMRNVRLKRAYFSAFHPIRDTPLENKPAVDPLREHRLYQASFLLRDYGFDLEEMPFTRDGNLPLPTDPKLAWAQVNLTERPLEINRADKSQLLRVPGIGLRGAEAILSARRTGKLRDLASLRKLGVVVARAAPFLLLDGKRPASQLAMF
jgi:predicted DNA-binding helix-hairpin-helix protein